MSIVDQARELAYSNDKPLTELTSRVQALYDSTTDPTEQRQIGSYLAVLKQRSTTSPRLADQGETTPSVRPARQGILRGKDRRKAQQHKPLPFGDPTRFVIQKGDVTVNDDTKQA